MSNIDIARFKSPALQFSGGKDSLACLYMLRGQLDEVPVYWLNTGDTPTETMAVIDAVKAWIPRFIEVRSDVKKWRATHGTPTDLLPSNAHFIALSYGLGSRPLTGRFDCCYHNIMAPLHQRMLDDGIDAVIRGTKQCDGGSVPAEGWTGDYSIVLPLRNWSHQQVFDYLSTVGAPQNAIYEHFNGMSAPECMGCTAWWGDGKAAYLRDKHPELLPAYQKHLRDIKVAIQEHLAELDNEIGV